MLTSQTSECNISMHRMCMQALVIRSAAGGDNFLEALRSAVAHRLDSGTEKHSPARPRVSTARSSAQTTSAVVRQRASFEEEAAVSTKGILVACKSSVACSPSSRAEPSVVAVVERGHRRRVAVFHSQAARLPVIHPSRWPCTA